MFGNDCRHWRSVVEKSGASKHEPNANFQMQILQTKMCQSAIVRLSSSAYLWLHNGREQTAGALWAEHCGMIGVTPGQM